MITSSIWKIGLWNALLLSIAYADTSYSYSWQERPRSEWEDFSTLLDFQSQRVHTDSNIDEPTFQKLVSSNAAVSSLPTYVQHTGSHLYPLQPEFQNPGTRFIPHHEGGNEVTGIRGEVDVSRERMGGFGGTGDTLGYGAYEYKANNVAEKEIPYTEILRVPKSRGTFIDKFIDDYPLQNL